MGLSGPFEPGAFDFKSIALRSEKFDDLLQRGRLFRLFRFDRLTEGSGRGSQR